MKRIIQMLLVVAVAAVALSCEDNTTTAPTPVLKNLPCDTAVVSALELRGAPTKFSEDTTGHTITISLSWVVKTRHHDEETDTTTTSTFSWNEMGSVCTENTTIVVHTDDD